MLDILYHSQRGRVCQYSNDGKSIVTPCAIKTIGCDDPVHIELSDKGRVLHFFGEDIELDCSLFTPESCDVKTNVVSKGKVALVRLPFDTFEIPAETEVVIVPNAFELRKDSRKLIDYIIKIRNTIGYNRLLFMPSLAEASTVALLSYMGVDLFDDSLARVAGNNNIIQIPEGEITSSENETERNVKALEEECEKIRAFIKGERLRELVDQRAPSSPSSVATLRIFDDIGFQFQEECCSTVGCRFGCNTTQALRRPEVLRYRKAILERYRKPENKKVLLLLPCSAKKPYHTSKTHKRFASAIHTASHDTLVHEVIVTSPLGIVPRELDVFFPANSYDIPVTGQWKCEEKAFIREMTKFILDQGYEKVVSHLGEDTQLVEGLCDMEETVVGDSASPASLEKLDETLRRITKGMEPCDYHTDRKETVRSVLTFQFGKDIADRILDEETECAGKFPYWKIIRGKMQIGMLTEERGMISLTMDGAELLASYGYNIVQMQKFELKGNLFAVGVTDADEKIRIGDEAIIVCEGNVMGVGVAMMSGREMKEVSRGIAVRIRHKKK